MVGGEIAKVAKLGGDPVVEWAAVVAINRHAVPDVFEGGLVGARTGQAIKLTAGIHEVCGGRGGTQIILMIGVVRPVVGVDGLGLKGIGLGVVVAGAIGVEVAEQIGGLSEDAGHARCHLWVAGIGEVGILFFVGVEIAAGRVVGHLGAGAHSTIGFLEGFPTLNVPDRLIEQIRN